MVKKKKYKQQKTSKAVWEENEQLAEDEKHHRRRPLRTRNLPTKFVPRFWERADARLLFVREIRQRYERLKADAGADSYQKELLAQRVVFVAAQLETMEIVATESGEFDLGIYTQAVNCLVGLLRSLGLEKKMKHVESLEHYVKSKSKSKRRRA